MATRTENQVKIAVSTTADHKIYTVPAHRVYDVSVTDHGVLTVKMPEQSLLYAAGYWTDVTVKHPEPAGDS